MNRFKIRHGSWVMPQDIARYGTVELDARLWKDEVILETDLSFEKVSKLSFVLAIKNLNNS